MDDDPFVAVLLKSVSKNRLEMMIERVAFSDSCGSVEFIKRSGPYPEFVKFEGGEAMLGDFGYVARWRDKGQGFVVGCVDVE